MNKGTNSLHAMQAGVSITRAYPFITERLREWRKFARQFRTYSFVEKCCAWPCDGREGGSPMAAEPRDDWSQEALSHRYRLAISNVLDKRLVPIPIWLAVFRLTGPRDCARCWLGSHFFFLAITIFFHFVSSSSSGAVFSLVLLQPTRLAIVM